MTSEGRIIQQGPSGLPPHLSEDIEGASAPVEVAAQNHAERVGGVDVPARHLLRAIDCGHAIPPQSAHFVTGS